MKKYLVLDIGGSSIKYAIMTDETEFLEKGSVGTPLDKLENLVETIGQLYDQYKAEIEGIAISMPGVLDVKRGYVYSGGLLSYNKDIQFIDVLQTRCPISITIENDGKCAALAEVWKGSLKNCQDGAVIILGSGVGGGIVIDRKVHKGQSSFAGEFSFMKTNPDYPQDMNHAWGWISGASALATKFSEVKGIPVEEVNGHVVFDAVNSNDADAIAVLDAFTKNIAIQIVNLQCIIDPERVAIGGGISAQPKLIESIRKNLEWLAPNYGYYKPAVEVVPCEFRNDSNLIGALYHYLTFEK